MNLLNVVSVLVLLSSVSASASPMCENVFLIGNSEGEIIRADGSRGETSSASQARRIISLERDVPDQIQRLDAIQAIMNEMRTNPNNFSLHDTYLLERALLRIRILDNQLPPIRNNQVYSIHLFGNDGPRAARLRQAQLIDEMPAIQFLYTP